MKDNKKISEDLIKYFQTITILIKGNILNFNK